MEYWQKKAINDNLANLIKNTDCNVTLLAQLTQKNIISEEESGNIKDVREKSKQSAELYTLLKTRVGGFEAIVNALKECSQSGAFRLLQRSIVAPTSQNEAGHGRISPLRAYFSKNLIISTIDCNLTEQTVINLATENQAIINRPILRNEKTQVITMKIYSNATDKTVRIVHADFVGMLQKELIVENEKYELIEDTFTWPQLSEDQKRSVLQKCVTFQGVDQKIQQICQHYEALTGKPKDRLLSKIDEQLLVQLLTGKQVPVISNGNVPPIPTFYVNRKLRSQTHISRRILLIAKGNNKPKDVLLLFGIELFELTSLLKKYGVEKCQRSTDIKEKIVCQIILLESTNYDSELERICALTNASVHLIKCITSQENSNEVKSLEWKKSRGSIATLSTYINIHGIEEEDFNKNAGDYSITSEVFCLAEVPGNGRTTFLARCAQHCIGKATEKKYHYTQYVAIGDFIKALIGNKNGKKQPDEKDYTEYKLTEHPDTIQTVNVNNKKEENVSSLRIFKVLAETSSQTSFGRTYVKALLSSKSEDVQYNFMLDGLDDLPPNQFELAVSAIKYLCKEKGKCLKIWVTTRPDLLESVETNLSLLGYIVGPMEKDNQVNLLTKYWYEQGAQNNPKLQAFAERCVVRLNLHQTLSEGQTHISGTSLILLLAEYFQDAAIKYSRNQDSSKKGLPSGSTVGIITLYQKFVNNRLDCSDMDIGKLELAHMHLAIQLVLPDIAKRFKNRFFRKRLIVPREEMLKFGIVQSDFANPGGMLKFIHKTLAEYFVASILMKMSHDISITKSTTDLSNSDNDVEKLLEIEELTEELIIFCRHVLGVQLSPPPSCHVSDCSANESYKFKFSNICHFLDLHIQNKQHNIPTVECILLAYCARKGDIASGMEDLWKCLNAAVSANFTGIAALMMRCMGHLTPPNRKIVFSHKVSTTSSFKCLLLLTAKHGNEVLMERVSKFFELWTKEFISDQEFKNSEGTMQTLLHVAVQAGNFYGSKCLLTTFRYSKEIRKVVYKNLFHACLMNSNRDTDAIVARKHKIIDLLVKEKAASYMQEDAIRDSILSLMVEPVNLELLFKLLGHIKELFPIFSFSNQDKMNLLHLLPTNYYETSMTPAKYHNILTQHVEKLFSLDELLKARDNSGLTPVDVAVSTLDLQENTLNKFDYYIKGSQTIVKRAIKGQRSGQFIKMLIERGALWQNIDSKRSVLHIAVEKYNYSAVKLFTELGKENVNIKDDKGNTPLHVSVRKRSGNQEICTGYESELDEDDDDSSSTEPSINSEDFLEGEIEPNNQHLIIRHLIENGAKIDAPNNDGETPFYAVIDICKGLSKDEFENLKSSDLFEPSSLNLALKGVLLNEIIGSYWHPSLIKTFADELVKRGASIVYQDNNACTLLHIAAKKHSIGVQYMLENNMVDANTKNKSSQTALEYMDCLEDCQKYNCEKIKTLLLDYQSNFSGQVNTRKRQKLKRRQSTIENTNGND